MRRYAILFLIVLAAFAQQQKQGGQEFAGTVKIGNTSPGGAGTSISPTAGIKGPIIACAAACPRWIPPIPGLSAELADITT